MKYISVLFLITCTTITFAQSVVFGVTTKDTIDVHYVDPRTVPRIYPSPKEAWSEPDKYPVFPGGIVALNKYFHEAGKLDISQLDKGVIRQLAEGGQMYSEFIINVEGYAERIKLIRHFNDEKCNKEAIRLIRNMPRWYPAMEKGEPVNFKVLLPILVEIKTETG